MNNRSAFLAEEQRPDQSGVSSVRFPLTPMQVGLIYESNLSDQPSLNLEQLVVHFDSESVDPARVRQIWEALAARHEILRLGMHLDAAEGPMQSVLPAVTPQIVLQDWRDGFAEAQTKRLQDWLTADRAEGIAVDTPAWRVTFCTLAPERSVMIVTLHHALLDGTGMRLLLDAFFAMLDDADNPPLSSDTTVLAAHCNAVAAQDKAAMEAHFGQLLAGFDTPNTLDPVFRPKLPLPGAGLATRKITHDLKLTRDQTQMLEARAIAANVTVATLVNAAWGIMLARTSGRADAVFGVTRAGRHLVQDAQNIMGCLITTVPLRIKLSYGQTLRAFLAELRRAQLETRPFEHVSLSDLRTLCDLPQGMALFDSVVMYDRSSIDAAFRARGGRFAQRRIELLEEGGQAMTLAVYHDAQMLLRLEHDPTHVSKEGAERLLGYVAALLNEIGAAGDDKPVARLAMLPEGEATRLMAQGRPAAMPRFADHAAQNPDGGIAAQFAAMASRQPDAVAVAMVGEHHRVTYGALAERANALAHLLRAEGIGAGDLVGIALPRGFAYIEALMGVVTSGAAFLPLDPSYPPEAIADMVGRGTVTRVLSDSATMALLGDLPAPVTDLSTLDLTTMPRDLPSQDGLDPGRLAYVIYTSGSTGPPKGVEIPHNAFMRHAAAASDIFALTPEDGVLQFTSLGFDISIEEIIPTLLSGARLVLRDATVTGSIPAFLAAVEDHGITVVNLPTAFWHLLVDHLDMTRLADSEVRAGDTRPDLSEILPPPLPPLLRLVIAGGEQVAPRALQRWQHHAPDLRWLNGYGPTETTITATFYEPGPQDIPFRGSEVPIGRPLNHVTAHVMTPDGALAPEGVTGELWLGGEAVALGYRGRPDLTDERFLPDPFTGSGRVYRTGDKVLWQPDGNLSFLGRIDRQVKLRGYRIELRAIELALEKQESVAHAVVALDEKGSQQARLLAWVVSAQKGVPVDPELLRNSLAASMPAHMLPLIVPVDDLPQTFGGKIDMRRLPRPAADVSASADADKTLSDDPDVQKMQEIFAQVLGVEAVGAGESFFDLDGQSLLAVRLLGQIEHVFGRRVSIAKLQGNATPLAIVAATRAGTGENEAQFIIPIRPEGHLPPLYGIHVLGENAGYYRPLAAHLGEDQPVFALSFGLLQSDSPVTIEDTAALYLNEIMRHRPSGPVAIAAVSQASYVTFELAQKLRAAGRDVVAVIFFDSEGPDGRQRVSGLERLRRHVVQMQKNGIGHALRLLRGRVKDLYDDRRFRKLQDQVRQTGYNAGEVNADVFEAATSLALDQYQPRPYDGSLTIFRAMDRSFDTAETIAAGLGWKSVARGGLEVIDTPGEHMSMLQEPHVSTLAYSLRRVIAGSQRDKVIVSRLSPVLFPGVFFGIGCGCTERWAILAMM